MKFGSRILLILLAAVFVAGLIHLFQLRFEGGDVYAPYSSLRADPLGTKALHDSLDDLVDVRRNYDPLTRLGEGRDSVLLHLGTELAEARFSADQYRALETFVRTGGRLVLALHPSYQPERVNRFTTTPPTPTTPPKGQGRKRSSPTTSPTPNPSPTPFPVPVPAPIPTTNTSAGTNAPRGSVPSPNPLEDPDLVPIGERWGLEVGHAPLARDQDRSYLPAVAYRVGPGRLPDRLAVHTAAHWAPRLPDWKVIYERREGTNSHPVVMERSMGRGSIVLCADAYPFSNEAMRRERQPELLAWSVGTASQVIFDETHLGTANDPGIAALARRYRLHGLGAALLLLAGLFIWRSSVPFLPPAEERLADEAAHQVAGKDAGEGFVHLLRRNVPPVDLLRVCLEQWNLTAAARPPARWKIEAMQKIVDEQNALDPRRRDPVGTCRRFREILSQRT